MCEVVELQQWDKTQEVVTWQSRGWEHGASIRGHFPKENREPESIFCWGESHDQIHVSKDSSCGKVGDELQEEKIEDRYISKRLSMGDLMA